MKKSLVALAALAVVGAASAQSTVTLYGAIDASFNTASADLVAGSQTKNFMGSSQLGSSKLGFMGSEDLGGGLKANFKIEGGLNNDTGAGKATNTNNQASGASSTQAGLTFQRFSYVGLSGDFGELRLGRDYVNTFLQAQAAVDPFGTNGPADSTNMALKLASYTATNASNMFGYTTPSMGGFAVNAQVFMGENASGSANPDDGGGYSLLGKYANGPVFVSVAQQETKYVAGDYLLRALSASYNFGPATVVYTYAHEEVAVAGTPKNDSNLIGVIVPVGAFNIKASYIMAERTVVSAGKGALLGLGVDYALSKRTTAYATYANVSNSDGGNSYSTGGVGTLAANGSSSNLAVGVYHKF